jgi:hypothetical protein
MTYLKLEVTRNGKIEFTFLFLYHFLWCLLQNKSLEFHDVSSEVVVETTHKISKLDIQNFAFFFVDNVIATIDVDGGVSTSNEKFTQVS